MKNEETKKNSSATVYREEFPKMDIEIRKFKDDGRSWYSVYVHVRTANDDIIVANASNDIKSQAIADAFLHLGFRISEHYYYETKGVENEANVVEYEISNDDNLPF